MSVKRDCLRGQIRQVLVQRIIDGSYRPGDRLVELQIAREFDTSQGPVREALRELEALRLVESQPYRGTRVREVGEQEMSDAALVRGVLEQSAAELGARALAADPSRLRVELAALRVAAAAGDLDDYAAHNRAFHRIVVAAAGNVVLLRLWDSLMLEVRTRVGLSQRALDLPAVAETHVAIVEALEAGDGVTAGRLLREHAEIFGGCGAAGAIAGFLAPATP